VAAGAAGAGRAFAGNSFQSQGAAGGAGGGGQNLENPTPIQSNFPNDQLATAINNLESRISGMSPGDVLTAGVKQTRNFVGDRVVADLSKNSTLTTQVARLVNRT